MPLTNCCPGEKVVEVRRQSSTTTATTTTTATSRTRRRRRTTSKTSPTSVKKKKKRKVYVVSKARLTKLSRHCREVRKKKVNWAAGKLLTGWQGRAGSRYYVEEIGGRR